MFEKKFEKKFDDTERYIRAVKGLEEYMGAVGDMCVYPADYNSKGVYSFSTVMFSSGSTPSDAYIEIAADSATTRLELSGSGASESQVMGVLNKLLLSLVMGKSSVAKKKV